jgi:hypothetical protein
MAFRAAAREELAMGAALYVDCRLQFLFAGGRWK